MPVQLVKRQTTAREFRKWQQYFAQSANSFHREDYYLAQIAMEVRRVLHGDPKSLKLAQFLIKFTTDKETTKSNAETYEQRLMKSKLAWGMAAGLRPRDLK